MSTPRERFRKVLSFEKPDDRLPMIEWAPWWDLTLARWRQEGMPEARAGAPPLEQLIGSLDYFGVDKLICVYGRGTSPNAPQPAAHGAGLVANERQYEQLRPFLYSEANLAALLETAGQLKERHQRGEVIIRLWLDGFFWFPRTILGIEPHLYAFYDQPDLLHRINSDLAEYNIHVVETLFPVLAPDMVGFAEDMSYNHGPMLSRRLFTQFLLPYYCLVIPYIQKYGVKVLVDSDGDITTMIPWLNEAGIQGAYPLERQAGVDVAAIRRQYPGFLMLGGYDKMVMPLGEAAMRAEFERLLPVMRSGGYIPSVDHQTPPGVSLQQYRAYLRLFEEYCQKVAA
jgi:uroporphyrinogen-III decarboxylase